jgi:hypothetical protein
MKSRNTGVIDKLIRQFLDSGDHSALLCHSSDENKRDLVAMLRADWRELPEGSLKHYSDVWDKSIGDCGMRGVPPHSPTLVQVATYATPQRVRGPTVPERCACGAHVNREDVRLGPTHLCSLSQEANTGRGQTATGPSGRP